MTPHTGPEGHRRLPNPALDSVSQPALADGLGQEVVLRRDGFACQFLKLEPSRLGNRASSLNGLPVLLVALRVTSARNLNSRFLSKSGQKKFNFRAVVSKGVAWLKPLVLAVLLRPESDRA